MVALLGGQETIPGDPAFPITLTYEQVAEATQAGFGPTPAESQAAIDEAQRQRDIVAAADWEQSQREKLAATELAAKFAHETYYGVGGEGYGTTPGGPDVYYFDYGQAQPTTYEKGTFFGADLPGLPGKDDLLLYGALAIGALALLKR
jgi:hypothetical protein